MNKVILMGRLTANPDYRQTQNGTAVCRFNIAVNRPYQKDKEQEVDFISCQAWRNTADFVSRYFSKGKPIIVEGSLRNNNYIDKNGVNHYGMDVLVSNAEFTISDNTQNQQQGQPQGNYYQQAPSPNTNYKQNSPQYQQPPQGYQQQSQPSQPVQPTSNLNNFEEVISDGEIPF